MTIQNTLDDSSRVLLTRKQAAEYLNCSQRFLEMRAIRGGGPIYIKCSARCVRYRLIDLDQWVQDRVRSSTSDSGVNK